LYDIILSRYYTFTFTFTTSRSNLKSLRSLQPPHINQFDVPDSQYPSSHNGQNTKVFLSLRSITHMPITQVLVILLLLTAQYNELQLYPLFPETLHLAGHLSQRTICQPHPASVANFLIRYQFMLAFILGILIYRKYSINAYLEEQGVLLLHFVISI